MLVGGDERHKVQSSAIDRFLGWETLQGVALALYLEAADRTVDDRYVYASDSLTEAHLVEDFCMGVSPMQRGQVLMEGASNV
jgi:hypothetical protein